MSRARKPHKASLDELPPAPWHPFPLGELCVLLGIVLIAYGFFADGARARTALIAGVALASIAGLEQAIREHFAGFRSHTTLLAGASALGTGIPLSFLLPYAAALVVALVVFAGTFAVLRRGFRRRAGVGFRA